MPRLPRGIFTREGRRGYYARDHRGGRDRKLKLSDDLETAKRKLRELRGTDVLPGRVTVAQAATKWLETQVATNRSPKFARLTRQRVERFLVPGLGKFRPLGMIRADEWRAYRLWLEGRSPALSPQSVAHVLSDARCFMRWAEEAELVARSTFPRRLLPRIQERPPDRLTDEEVERLVSMPEPWGFYLRLLLGTGIRWSEARRADASHVERGQLVVSQTKSGKIRRVPLSDGLVSVLQSRIGALVPIANAQTLAARSRAVSGVDRFHVHQTRHTYACRWLEAGGSIEALREVLGHSTVKTTERYGKVSEAAVRREAERSWG